MNETINQTLLDAYSNPPEPMFGLFEHLSGASYHPAITMLVVLVMFVATIIGGTYLFLWLVTLKQ